jgi:hypothetical protein
MQTGARANRNVDLRLKGPLGRLAVQANHVLWKTLPRSVHRSVRDAALKVLSTRKSAAETAGVLDLPEVRDFVAEHYAGDIRLYRAVAARRDEIRAGLASNDLARVFSTVAPPVDA